MMQMLKKWYYWIIPPKKWQPKVAVLLGILVGLGLSIIHLSNATSYLSDKPDACINCHVMYPQYHSWFHSSHARVANCNDCHVPHDNVFREYYFHAVDGLRHSTWFTMRWEPQVIMIKQAGKEVVQENCKRCHADLVSMVSLTEVTGKNATEGKGHKCWDCHRETPHGTVNSLSSAPNAIIPKLPPTVPDWLKINSKKH